jgi:hypothetical protein
MYRKPVTRKLAFVASYKPSPVRFVWAQASPTQIGGPVPDKEVNPLG